MVPIKSSSCHSPLSRKSWKAQSVGISEPADRLNEEIAGMARAGLPLDQGLAALAREMGGGRLRQVTAELADDLRRGKTLPEALERQGDRVPPYYSSLVMAGVRTGRIGDVLTTLT